MCDVACFSLLHPVALLRLFLLDECLHIEYPEDHTMYLEDVNANSEWCQVIGALNN